MLAPMRCTQARPSHAEGFILVPGADRGVEGNVGVELIRDPLARSAAPSRRRSPEGARPQKRRRCRQTPTGVVQKSATCLVASVFQAPSAAGQGGKRFSLFAFRCERPFVPPRRTRYRRGMGGRKPWNPPWPPLPCTAHLGACSVRRTVVPPPGVQDLLEGVKVHISIGGFLHRGRGRECQTVRLLLLLGRRTPEDNGQSLKGRRRSCGRTGSPSILRKWRSNPRR
jgi:hypothetical protein